MAAIFDSRDEDVSPLMTATTNNYGEKYLTAIADFTDNFNEYSKSRCYADDLPKDLWVQIFIRCSVESLLVLTSVCKLWNLFIKDPNFLCEHRQFQKMMSENIGHFLLLHENQIDGVFNYFLFDGESVAKASMSSVSLQPNHNLFQVSLGHRKRFNQFIIDGPINGLYCLHNQQGRVIIWNPSTNEIGFLPLAQDCIPGEKYDDYGQLRFLYGGVIGFGTDPLYDENYKVILISECISPGCDSIVPSYTMLYTSRTNTWRYLTDEVGGVVETLNNTYLNGSYYWMLEFRNAVLVFDLTENESFRYITTPCNGPNRNLALHNNLITLFHTYWNLNEIDIWVMLEENNWLKLKKVSISGIRGHVVSTLGFWKTGNNLLIVIDDSNCHHVTQTVLYDIYTGGITKLGPRGLCSFKAVVYHESLTSLSGDIIKYKGNDRDSLLDTACDFLLRQAIEDEEEN